MARALPMLLNGLISIRDIFLDMKTRRCCPNLMHVLSFHLVPIGASQLGLIDLDGLNVIWWRVNSFDAVDLLQFRESMVN
jgi:hypothetical protein